MSVVADISGFRTLLQCEENRWNTQRYLPIRRKCVDEWQCMCAHASSHFKIKLKFLYACVRNICDFSKIYWHFFIFTIVFYMYITLLVYQFIYLLYLIWSRKVSAKKRAEKIFAALRKNGRQKPFLTGIDKGRTQCFSWQYMEELLIMEFLIKQSLYLVLLDIKMIITNSALHASLVIYHFISSMPS